MNNIQSIIFDKNIFTLDKAKKWITKHNYKLTFYNKPVDITEKYYRFRQQSPNKYKTYRTKEIDNGILFILGY